MEKMWGGEPFWGLGYEWDPDWFLTERQKELRAKLIELCETEMRANAKRSDDELLYPRRNFEILAENGFLAPDGAGGIRRPRREPRGLHDGVRDARPLRLRLHRDVLRHAHGAVATIMLRPTDELVDKYIRPLNSDVKIGTLSYSDPETGSHFWYPFSSKAEKSNGGYKVNKKASWTTSGGFADFYVVQTTSPDFKGYDDLSVFVIDGEDVKAQPSLWDALGLRGNQSGPIQVEDVEIPGEQIVGPLGDGAASNDEAVDPWFLIGSSSVWNGITMGAIDIAKRHTTRKRHVDVGMRVADYPTIQDYVGEAVMDTNACRVFVMSVAQAMDRVTDDNRRILEPGETARADYLHWAWQIKFEAAKNTAYHVDKMLHACGGSGYKRDMELERYVRDAKAGWVMGPTNEVLRQFVGKAVLLGFDALDYWNQTYNRRVVENEVKKLDSSAQARPGQGAHGAGRQGRGERAGRQDVTIQRTPPLLVSGLRPIDRSFETWWVRPGSATVVELHGGRPGDRDRPGGRPAGRADGAVARRPRRRWRAGRRRGHPRHRPARAGGERSRRRLPRHAARERPPTARRDGAAPVRARGRARGLAGVRVRAGRAAGGRGSRRPPRGRRSAGVRARGRGQARRAAQARRRRSCRRRSPSRGSTSAWTARARCPTRCARASTSR